MCVYRSQELRASGAVCDIKDRSNEDWQPPTQAYRGGSQREFQPPNNVTVYSGAARMLGSPTPLVTFNRASSSTVAGTTGSAANMEPDRSKPVTTIAVNLPDRTRYSVLRYLSRPKRLGLLTLKVIWCVRVRTISDWESVENGLPPWCE